MTNTDFLDVLWRRQGAASASGLSPDGGCARTCGHHGYASATVDVDNIAHSTGSA